MTEEAHSHTKKEKNATEYLMHTLEMDFYDKYMNIQWLGRSDTKLSCLFVIFGTHGKLLSACCQCVLHFFVCSSTICARQQIDANRERKQEEIYKQVELHINELLNKFDEMNEKYGNGSPHTMPSKLPLITCTSNFIVVASIVQYVRHSPIINYEQMKYTSSNYYE